MANGAARLRIGVDATNVFHDRRGIGRYVRALLHRWLTDASTIDIVLLVAHPLPKLVESRMANALEVPSVRVAHRTSSPRRGFDLVWHPWNGIFFDSGTRDVATIHDVWPFVDAPAHDPELARHRQEPFDRAAAKASRIITDSRFSKDEISRHLGVDREKIDVVALGVETELLAARPPRITVPGADRFVLFVGESEARKDLSTLLSAMGRLPKTLRDSTPLVVAGKHVSSVNIPSGVRVEFPGEVTDERLTALYASAAVFAFPSRYEGFGLPVLEAMALGTPVVASNAASIPEAGGDAAVYFPAGDADALAIALHRVLTDESYARELREKGRRRAAAMTWDRCATSTLDVFFEVAARTAK